MRRIARPERACGAMPFEVPVQSSQPYILTSERAEELFASHGKTFHFAARFFPAERRNAIVTLYAFFRVLDDLVDERHANWRADEVQRELEAWQVWFRNGFSSPAPREPLGTALAALLCEYQIPIVLFEDFLDGLFSDLKTPEFPDFHTLYHYCYQVAGTVGLALAHVLGRRSEQALAAARHLGIAMQLTNILRDVGGDLANGRIYLPQDELVRFNCPPTHLHLLYEQSRGPDERFRTLMSYQLQRAHLYYAKGLHGSWLLPQNCRLPILLAGRLYQRILIRIEQNDYDVLRRRVATSTLTKIREAGVVFLLDRLWQHGEVELPTETEPLYES